MNHYLALRLRRRTVFLSLVALGSSAFLSVDAAQHPETAFQYHAIVQEYRCGNTDAAARALLALEDRDVLRALDQLARGFVAGQLQRPWTSVDLRAAIVFHTDLAIRGIQDVAVRRAWQLRLARRLSDALAARAQDPASDTPDEAAFLRRWHLVMAWQAQGSFELDDALAEVDELRRLCPADTEVLLTDGTLCETLAWPALRSSLPRPLTHPRTRRGRASLLADAEARYRDVLARSPASSEGALRLGRVLHEQGRYREALEVLGPMLDSSQDEWASYLGRLFAGAACERMDRFDEAAAHYRTARELRPGAQTAGIALSFVLRKSGGEAAARSALARWAAPAGQSSDDPWWEYQAGQWRHVVHALEALRLGVAQ